MQAILDRVKMSSSYDELHVIIKKIWKELKKNTTYTDVQELLVKKKEQVKIKKKSRSITAMLLQPTGRCSKPQKDILSTQTLLQTDFTSLVQSLQTDMSNLVHSNNISLVAELMMISSKSDMQNPKLLTNMLM